MSLSRKASSDSPESQKRLSLTALRDKAVKRLESFEDPTFQRPPKNESASNSKRSSMIFTPEILSSLPASPKSKDEEVMSPILSQLPSTPLTEAKSTSHFPQTTETSPLRESHSALTDSLGELEVKQSSSSLTHITTDRPRNQSRGSPTKNPARYLQELSPVLPLSPAAADTEQQQQPSPNANDKSASAVDMADKQPHPRPPNNNIGFKLPGMLPGGIQLKKTTVSSPASSGQAAASESTNALNSPMSEVDKIRAKLRSVAVSKDTAATSVSAATPEPKKYETSAPVKEPIALFNGGGASKSNSEESKQPEKVALRRFEPAQTVEVKKQEQPKPAQIPVKEELKQAETQASLASSKFKNSSDNLARDPVNLAQIRSQLKNSGSRVDLAGNLKSSRSDLTSSSRDVLASGAQQQQIPEFMLLRNKLRAAGDAKSSQPDLSVSTLNRTQEKPQEVLVTKSVQPSPGVYSPVNVGFKSASAVPSPVTPGKPQSKWSITPSGYNKTPLGKTSSSANIQYQAPIVQASSVSFSNSSSSLRLDDMTKDAAPVSGSRPFAVNLKATRTDQFIASGGGALRIKEPLLWVIKGKRRLLAQKQALNLSAINQTDPLILDMAPVSVKQSDPDKPLNRLLYVLSGSNASKVRRTKAIEIANLMKDFDYSGKADIHLVEIGNIKERSIPETEMAFWQTVIGGTVQKSEIAEKIEGVPVKTPTDDADFETSFDASVKLTKFENGTSELVASNGKELKRGLLASNKCAVLECGTEIYVWAGKTSADNDRQAAIQFAEDKAKSKNMLLFMEGEKFERTTFKLKFEDWQAGKELSVYNVLEVKQAGNIKAKDKEWRVYDRGSDTKKVDKVDIAKMYDKNSSTGNDVAKNTEALDIDPAELIKRDWGFVNLRAWTIHEKVQGADKSAKIAVTPAVLDSMERKFDSSKPLTLFSQECYIFLYEYKERPSTMTDTVLTERLKFTKEELVGQMKDVVLLYAWIGAESNVADQGVMAHLMLEIEKIVKTTRGMPAKGRHVRVIEGKESIHFLNVIRGGNIPRDQPKKILDMIPRADVAPCPVVAYRRNAFKNFSATEGAMYHVAGSTVDEVRVSQLPAVGVELLCSAHSYVVTDGRSIHVWYGNGSFAWEREAALCLAKDVLKTELTGAKISEIKDGAETQEFWAAIKGSPASPRSNESFWSQRPSLPTSWVRQVSLNSTQGSADKAPYDVRLWKINHFLNGNPTATEITPFAYEDLEEDCVYILDAYFQLFVWVGATIGRNKTTDNDANEPALLKKVPTEKIEAKAGAAGYKDLRLALQTAARYADFISERENGRLPRTSVIVVQSGDELPIFKSQFPYWKARSVEKPKINVWPSALTIDKGLFHFDGIRYAPQEIRQFAQSRIDLPFGLDLENLERFLAPEDFTKIFGVDLEQFSQMPQWKQIEMKRKLGFF